MSFGTQTSLTPDWDEEKAKQEEIAGQIESDAPVKSTPQIAGTPVETQQEVVETDLEVVEEVLPQVTLRPVGDDIEYPLTLSVVGAPEDGFVFDGPDSTIDVDPQVAENVAYVSNVEVVA